MRSVRIMSWRFFAFAQRKDTMSKRILLIDGDLVVYRNAAAAEKRFVDVTHIKSGHVKRFDNRTQFKDFLKAKDFPYDPAAYFIKDIQEPLPVGIAFNIIDKLYQQLHDVAWPDSTEVYIGQSGSTFRHHLPLPKPYKFNRDDSIKPTHLEACKRYLKKQFGAVVCDAKYETDDVLTIRAYEELAKGNIPIIATIDKDAGQSQGVGLLNWNNEPIEVKTVPELGGPIYNEKSSWKGNGVRFLAFQTLAGDPTDTYCAYDASNVKYGPTKAANVLNTANSPKEVLELLIGEFKKLFPLPVNYKTWDGKDVMGATWEDMLQMYWKCAYMKRSWDDPSDFWEYAKRYEVTK